MNSFIDKNFIKDYDNQHFLHPWEDCSNNHSDYKIINNSNGIYSRIVFDEESIRKNYKIMNLHNPMMDDLEKNYVEDLIDQPVPLANAKTFLRFYQEDGLRHLIKNVDFWINNQFRTLNSFGK